VSDAKASDATDNDTLRRVLKSQYHACLAMLREPVERCPDDLWEDPTARNAFWQVAYHTLYIAHLYLMPEEAAFRPWEKQQSEVQHPDGIAGPADPDSPLPLIPEPYTRAQVLAYWDVVDGMVDGAVDAIDLAQPTSGFHWYRMSKLEHQFVNLRHIQHHAAQLADRIRAALDIGTRWVGARPSA
jgi:hypothetical protein